MKKRILVVDDSAMIRRILRKELEADGNYEVFEAEDGQDALEQLSQVKPDLVTLDVDMPRLNGFDTCYRIRTDIYATGYDPYNLPIVFITANDNLEDRSKGFEVGASEFLTKPFLTGEVLGAINRILFPAQTLESVTALVVDDSKTTRQLVVNILKSEGINVISAKNGMKAWEIIKEKRYEIDMILTDFEMPEMTGGELCIKIRKELGLKSLPVIFLSGLTERENILEMFSAGATDYLIKPFAKEELLARLKVHIEARLLNRRMEENVIELKRLSKLKDEFLAVTSHDLRSPLNGILGFTELLSQSGLNEEQLEFCGHVAASGNFLLTLINEILDLGRMNANEGDMEMKEIDLLEVIDDSIHTLKHMATPKSIEIQLIDECKQPPVVMGNQNALLRIFNNLLSNAIKFTSTGGKVTQRLSSDQDGHVVVEVSDTGIGIPKDKIEELFEKYTKASRSGTAGEKSTGLGMSITKELVEAHDGTIEVTSIEGEGTTFKLTFPMAGTLTKVSKEKTSVVEPEEETPASAPAAKPKMGLRCLLVDDNELNLKLANLVLNQQGCDVTTAKNGQDAADLFRDSLKGTPFEMVFMDINMPVLNGVESAKLMRAFEGQMTDGKGRIPIIAMTAGTSEAERERCKGAGMDQLLEKPLNLMKLQEMIESYVES